MESALLSAKEVRKELRALGNPKKARKVSRYFKTNPGEYGEGDIFLGITMPEQHRLARRYLDLALGEIEKLLRSKEHECRMTALLILANKYVKADTATQQRIYEMYLGNLKWINNWDLVDTSAEYIVGAWLEAQPEKMSVLSRLAKSDVVWERRIAMLATFAYIKKRRPDEAFQITEMLINDPHDLIHKAVGWMLREVGKSCGVEVEEEFLRKYYRIMPRTMLRYAIERFPEERRQSYLNGTAK